MELDFGRDWTIVAAAGSATVPGASSPADFAATELADAVERFSNRRPLLGGDGSGERLIVLDHGSERHLDRPAGYRWRAASDRVELYGDNAAALLRCVYDFLGALGLSWPAPGPDGERLPHSASVRLVRESGSAEPGRPGCTLVLGHGAYFARWRDYLLWAARNGYSSIFFHTTHLPFALGAIPAAAYEGQRSEIASLALRLGLEIELGGHLLSGLVPHRSLADRPELLRMVDGDRRADGNLCPSAPEGLAPLARAAADFARDHPEVVVFHLWPEDLPGGGWCSCPACAAARLGPSAQSLKTSLALAGAVAAVRPDARLSFLAYHDTEDIGQVELGPLPRALELVWAPRRRSWASGLDGSDSALNAASAAAFRAASAAWRVAGGGRVTVFEYWEDSFLFKGAAPPLPRVMAGDLRTYAPETGTRGADCIDLLLTGGRLPLAPRPNPWLLPRLVSEEGSDAGRLMDAWTRDVYGPSTPSMAKYWAALEAAWSIALDVAPGDGELRVVSRLGEAVDDPPADWGDPRLASAARLGALRGRCEELFERLRAAEEALAAAESSAADGTREARAVAGEQAEYRIASRLLELDCARLSVYHELAAGEGRAAADLALLAQSALGAYYDALKSLRDTRSRRELRLVAFLFYGLRLRAIRRAGARNPLRRLLDRGLSMALVALRALPLYRCWERAAPRRGGL